MTEAPTLALPDLLEPTSTQNVLDNVDRVLDLVAAEAERGEREARLSPVLAQVFRTAGFFQLGFSKRVGGLEASVHDQVRVVARIARVDAGAAWNVGVLNATGYYACRLPDEAYEELYPTRDQPTSGSFHPRGRAVQVPDGYLVSGRWDWGSGRSVAEHVIGGCVVYDEQGEPVLSPHTRAPLVLGLWLPNDAITSIDNWQVLGQRASGSGSYCIEEPVFVPATHGFDREPPPDATQDPLNKHVTTVFFGLLGIHLGLAQHALDLAYEAVARRSDGDSGRLDTATKRLLGEAIAEVDVATAYVLDVARRTDEVIFTPGRLLTPVEQARQDSVNLMTGQALHRVLDLATELYSSRYVFDDDPLQRVVRDAHVALSHAGAKPMHWQNTAAAALDHAGRAATLFDEPLAATS